MDIWAVTPANDDDKFRADAPIAGAGALTLLANDVDQYGCGYKILFTSAGDDSGITFTVVGTPVGKLSSGFVTEVVTGGAATTASTTAYWARINSITASGASAGNVKIGTTGSLAFPRTRIKGVYFVGATSAGSIVFTRNGTTGPSLLTLNTAASSTAATDNVVLPGQGILTARSSQDDYAVMTLTQVSAVTVFCG